MCGIAGIINTNTEPVTINELKCLTDGMYKRGPDGEGFYRNKNIGLGMRRLAIIDLQYLVSGDIE